MKLLRRILVEKRAIVLPIALAIVGNVVAYVFVAYPLLARVSSAESRRAAAERDRQAAVRELADARATDVSGHRAEADLRTFYHDVLPAGLGDARKAVYLRLAQLAREHNLRYQRQSVEEVRDTLTTPLHRLRLAVVLEGTYEDVRRFLHAVETAPEFLIIDTMGLAFQGDMGNAPLVLNLSVSTYFWTGAHET